MRYFRHAPLAFWTVFAILFGGLIATALYVARDNTPEVNVYNPTYSQRDSAFSMMQRISGMYPAVTANNLKEWALETESIALYNLDLYIANGGSEDDAVGTAWNGVAQSSRELSDVDTSNNPLVLEKTASLGQAGQKLIVTVDSYTTPSKGVSR